MAYQVIEAVEFKSETFPKSSLGGATYQQQYSTSEPTQLKQGTQTSSSFYEVILPKIRVVQAQSPSFKHRFPQHYFSYVMLSPMLYTRLLDTLIAFKFK